MNVWVTIGLSALTTLSIALAVLFILWLVVRMVGRRIEWLIPAYESIRPRLAIFCSHSRLAHHHDGRRGN